jgi:hypothetical protein
MTTLSIELPVVEIKSRTGSASYSVETIPAGEFGVAAIRLTKLVNGESYDLLRTNDNGLECTCPDFVCRHEGKGTCCKHLSFAVANGFLPVAPSPAPVEVKASTTPAPAPRVLTHAEVKRIEYFRLAWPVGAIAPPAPVVEAPAPVTPKGWDVIEPTPVAEIEPEIVEPTTEEEGDWDDDFRWELGPEPTVEVEAQGPRPTRLDRFVPSLEMEAEWLGMSLGLAGEPAEAPTGWSYPQLVGFFEGWLVGNADFREEQAEFHAWLDEVNARNSEDRIHPAELAEAGYRSDRPVYDDAA